MNVGIIWIKSSNNNMRQQQLEQLRVKNSSAIAAGASPVSEITVVNFLGRDIRVLGTPEDPLFIAKDVAGWIEHSNVSAMTQMLEEQDIRKVYIISDYGTVGAKQTKEVLAITEQGLYKILWRSNKPEAQKFASKCADIIKEIRLKGSYSTTPKTYIDALKALVASEEEKERLALMNKQQQIQIEEDRPKVDAYDDMMSTEGWLTFSEAAKTIFGQYSDQGRNQLFEYCRKHGYIRPGSTEPYQQYVNLGWFKVVVVKKYNKNKVRTYNKTLMSPIGFSNIYQQIRAEVIDRFLFEL